jgi:hypothetical protein
MLSMLSFGWLLVGVAQGTRANLATLGGVAAAYAWFAAVRLAQMRPRDETPKPPDAKVMHNGVRYAVMKKVVASGIGADFDRLIVQCEAERVQDVNVCPPHDFKPDDPDGYCIRCEGFAECAARFLRLNRPS